MVARMLPPGDGCPTRGLLQAFVQGCSCATPGRRTPPVLNIVTIVER